ncbi:hypothetical protein C900_05387 [Fulvivirga imtechensis AK7]|uniref:Uncharacterized protein n=1 Tax=Fulvivirga imtechensis AK7 TaxID=1237149 RepID=L8JJV6_9BACT|nr:hypothetical protein [Fulvivirga imtechensis]ELR69191.1 hypothetical protein C900_05387 [Fulvivirga imtechensis AK7]
MSKPIVKINAKGKVMLTLSRSIAMLIKPTIERLIEDLIFEMLKLSKPLSVANAEYFILIDLLKEIYVKYYAELDTVKGQYKMTWSRAQAICFWECSQRFPSQFHPLMNKLLLELHQKLS